MTGMLASVANLAEARLAAAAGADIIDLKAPRFGALGALPVSEVRLIVTELRGQRPISATVGDLPMCPSTVFAAVQEMAATGVDYVKIGFFPEGDWDGTLEILRSMAAAGVSLVAVLFADQPAELDWLPRLAKAGFAGAMLDTMDKDRGSLTEVRDAEFLRAFVNQAQAHGLLCGLAGSLRARDIVPLRELAPDYLGFRGALCHGARRVAEIDVNALQYIRAMLHASTATA
ncbi:(5-formylfuran-3-yl)methyl phosphate synthase [Methyloterricola oryzae]|uniref:(5-formylfuran-3-yl)methyl phosphate synthase n=1 Tax=Methyloterricola oryzae TaxID=1495050 RepID=UPI0005EBC8CD|nr:(5-formylfuran-3-yl)methyl phosphate synthase [Methyloterricola oryzae]